MAEGEEEEEISANPRHTFALELTSQELREIPNTIQKYSHCKSLDLSCNFLQAWTACMMKLRTPFRQMDPSLQIVVSRGNVCH